VANKAILANRPILGLVDFVLVYDRATLQTEKFRLNIVINFTAGKM
jgi:hypothetical protein